MKHRSHRILVLLATALLAPLAPAQSPFRQGDPVFDTTPGAGSREGTERWIVHLAQRPFTLDALREEYRAKGGADPAKVEKLVADLEQSATAHQAALVDEVQKLGGKVLKQFWIINACTIEIEPKHLTAVRNLANVAFLQPDALQGPGGVVAPIKTATDANNHHADELQAKGITGAGVGIAILDTGHDSNMNGTGKPHITYSNQGSTTSTRLVFNKKFGLMAADDVHGHGTAVDSCAAGWKWNTASADHGQAYDAKIAGYAVADFANSNSFETTRTAAWQQVVVDAAANNIKVGNMSYAGSPLAIAAMSQAMDTAVLTADLLLCTAAGNSGADISTSPVNLNGLSVGAVNAGTHTLAGFSATGIMTDGGTFPDLVANGVAMNMAQRDNEAADNANSGTSFASPLVAGAAALIRAANPALQANETKAIVLASVEASPGTAFTQQPGTGCGYLRDDLAYQIAMNPHAYGRSVISNAAPVVTWPLTVKAGQVVQVAIAWNRMDVTKADFSDLDLELKRGTVSLVGSFNTKNSEEFVRFTATADEVLSVRVSAFAIRNTTVQEFAWATNVDNGVKVFTGVGGPGYGASIAAGDFNGDGYEDIVIGHPGSGGNLGGLDSFSGKDLNAVHRTFGGNPNARLGASVALADMDLDGKVDLVVGAPGGSGLIWVANLQSVPPIFTGFASGTSVGLGELLTIAPYLDADGYPDVVAVDNGNTELVAFSGKTKQELWRKTPIAGVAIRSLATVGDINGDGLDDIILGLPTYNNVGTIELRSGKTGSLIRFTDGSTAGASLGASVAGIGDIDGDGIGDYLFGLPDHPSGGTKRGRIGTQSGRTGALIQAFGGTFDFGGFGYAVCGARGDLDADGTPDFLVSSVPAGKVEAFSGKDGRLIRVWNGPSTTFGAAIACVQSSGDDRPDLIVAEPGFNRANLFYSPQSANPPGYFEYGVPCIRSNGAYPRCWFPGAPARIGRATTVCLASGAPSAPASLQIGTSRAALDLSGLGLVGCEFLLAPLADLSAMTSSTGAAALTIPIPLSLPFIGGTVHFQWLCIDSAKTPFPVALSTGGTLRVGSQF